MSVVSAPLSAVVPDVGPAAAVASTTAAIPEYSAMIKCTFAAWLRTTATVSALLPFEVAIQICSPIPTNGLATKPVAGVKVLPSVSVTDVMVAVGTFVPMATRRRSDVVTGYEKLTEYVETIAPGVPELVWTRLACVRGAEIKISRPTKMKFPTNLAMLVPPRAEKSVSFKKTVMSVRSQRVNL